jgi:hypothetical protein
MATLPPPDTPFAIYNHNTHRVWFAHAYKIGDSQGYDCELYVLCNVPKSLLTFDWDIVLGTSTLVPNSTNRSAIQVGDDEHHVHWQETELFIRADLFDMPIFIFNWLSSEELAVRAVRRNYQKFPFDSPSVHERFMHLRQLFLSQTAASAVVKTVMFPSHIYNMVVQTAINSGECCPVTTEPIRKETAVLTSCGHVFSESGLKSALAHSNLCAICRKPCSLVPRP